MRTTTLLFQWTGLLMLGFFATKLVQPSWLPFVDDRLLMTLLFGGMAASCFGFALETYRSPWQKQFRGMLTTTLLSLVMMVLTLLFL